METWIRYGETNYEVSDFGAIRTIAHTTMRSNGLKHTVKQTVLAPAKDKKGYLRVALMLSGKLTTFKVHRLVAMCHIPNPLNLPEVNHRFGDKEDNRAVMLEWATGSQNVQHAFDTGLMRPNSGSRENKENFKRGIENHATKLTEEIVKEARLLYSLGSSYQKIADKFGVNKKTMIHAIKGITWQNVK